MRIPDLRVTVAEFSPWFTAIAVASLVIAVACALFFRQEAVDHLEEVYDFIADAGSPDNAASFTESIVSFCLALPTFHFGEQRAMTSARSYEPSVTANAYSSHSPSSTTR